MQKSGYLLLFAFVLAFSIAGCYSVPADSDIPWNQPQGWEGSPHIPGFSE